MPKTRLFELLIKLRADQLDRETAWNNTVQARAKIIAQRKGSTGPIQDETGCLLLAEEELKSEDATEWRRLVGDRFLDNGVWRQHITPWNFVLDKLIAERGMPFTEVELFEAVRHVQLEEAEEVDLAIRQFMVQQDDIGYTDELLAGLWTRFPTDAEAIALEKPEGQRSDEMTLAEASREYGVPSWTLSRAAKKPAGDHGHLPSTRIGRNVYVTRKNARAFAKTYDAEREQRTVGSLSNDEEARNIVASLKKIRKSSPRRKRAKS